MRDLLVPRALSSSDGLSFPVHHYFHLTMSCLDMLLVLLFPLLLTVSGAAAGLTSGPHLADVNILLPPKMTHPVEYRLQGTDGCFKWSWDHHDILALLPEYNSSSRCSTSARLKSIAPYSGRKETAVYATDVNTGMVIRCKVYIDIFSRIQIFHNSVKLDLDGLATLRVRAFDSEENVFSSLVGLQFMWQLMPENDGLSHHLVHVPLKDSPLSDCGGLCGDLDIQVKLEDSGVFSDLYVVKGIEIGHEIVSVHLVEKSFENMEDKIVLTVAEAMSLDPPSPVFVLIGAVVQYNLKIIRGNTPHAVSLPSIFHRWSVLNSTVAEVDRTLGEVYALNLGLTTVIVEDTRVAGHTQTSSLHVVLPDTIVLYILPLSASGSLIEQLAPISSMARWYVVSGRKYLIHVKVFSQGPGAQEIYITENDDIKLHDNLYDFWNLIPVSDTLAVKRNSKILETIANGLGKLTATLAYRTGDNERKEIIKVVQEVMVCDQVKFRMSEEPRIILLPWAPGIYQELELKVTGGCTVTSSDYRWISLDTDIVSVSASGIVQSKNPGKATIKAVSIYDPLNFDEVVIEVSIPSMMVMLQNFPVEIQVGSHLRASVTLKAPDGAYFDRCDAFSPFIKWKADSESFTIINATDESLLFGTKNILEFERSSYGPPCAWTHIFASDSGRTMLHATLSKEYQQLDQSMSGFVVLKASLRIGAYMPLILHEASDGNQFGGYWFNLTELKARNRLRNLERLYLVPDTHFDIMLHGGPEKWGQGVKFIESLDTANQKHSNKDGVLVHPVSADRGTLYRVKCERKGTFKLAFKRGNLVGDTHPLPAISEAELILMCDFPSLIVLVADESVNSQEAIESAIQADRGPGRIRSSPITVANGRTIRLSAVGISDAGIAFGNSSSLHLNWELSNCGELAFWDNTCISRTVKSSWEKFLGLQNTSGLCTIRATVVEHSENTLTDAARLQIVSSLRVNPEFSLLFYSKDARLNLSIAGGSCYLDTHVNNSQVLEIVQLPLDLQCLQLMLAPKRLGTALVTVYDIGLAPPLAASSVVQVAGIDWIKITSGDEISLMKGSSLSISFLAGIDDGLAFDASQYAYMNISVHIEENIVGLDDDYNFKNSGKDYVRAPNFTILGANLGVTTLYLSARRHSGEEVRSQSIKLEVYVPPRIHPSSVYVVPGASYVLTVRGGPSFGSRVEYSCMDDEIAKVHMSVGRLSAISPGNTTLVATFYGNGNIMICQAYGKVKVGVPSSAVLNVQSEQLAINRKMPIFPSLSEGNLFSFYELCGDYKWSITDEEILGFDFAEPLQGVNHSPAEKLRSIDYLDSQDLGFLKVLQSRAPGMTRVSVSFSCDFRSNSFLEPRLYSAFVSLWVVPDLPLALGSPITWILPPHYTSSTLLPLSWNPYSKEDSTIRKSIITYSLLGETGVRTGEAQHDLMLDGGRIKTREAGRLACIQARDRSTGRAEVASCVRVAEVVQARILTNDMIVLKMAVGSEFDLPIKYYDVLGNPFQEAYNVNLVEAETNFPDIVNIDGSHYDGKVHLKAISHGKALVRIAFTNDPHKSDYMLISVGAHLHPTNPVLHEGSHLSFGVEGLSDQAQGHWFSANSSVLNVNALSGEADAVSEGSTEVYYECSNMKLQTKVTVLKGNLMTVDAPKELLTNSPPFPAKGYFFPVELSDAYKNEYNAVGNGKVMFDCSLDPSYVGFVKPWGDPNTGKSYCIFFPYFPEHLARSVPENLDMRQGILISVNASLRGENNISGSASALFIGGFSLLEMDEKSLQLNLTQNCSGSFITLVGNTDVKIHHDQDLLSVRAVDGRDSTKRRYALYEVKVCKAEGFKDKLIITLPATGQKMEVGVSFEPERRGHDESARVMKIAVTCAVGILLLVLTVTCILYRVEEQGENSPRDRAQTRTTSAPSTPIRSGPPERHEHSPRTPQPFIDYVRRTIDETPYYRQDFRRRANPQNTF